MRTFLLAATLLAGCELWPRVCNRVLYTCGLDVRFEDGGLSAEGEWIVTAEFDGEVVTCALALPAEPGAWVLCEDQGSDLGASLVVSEDGSSIESLDLRAANPDEITVTVAFAGEELHSELFAPDYEVTEPNGEGCGECHSATVQTSVSTPD